MEGGNFYVAFVISVLFLDNSWYNKVLDTLAFIVAYY